MKTDRTTQALALALLLLPGIALAQESQNSTSAGVTMPLPLTPQQAEGPYYPTQKPADRDNDLTRVEMALQRRNRCWCYPATWWTNAIHRSRRPASRSGRRIIAASICIRKTLAQRAGTATSSFYGEANTDELGRFSFRTILPGLYGSTSPAPPREDRPAAGA